MYFCQSVNELTDEQLEQADYSREEDTNDKKKYQKEEKVISSGGAMDEIPFRRALHMYEYFD
ncbi:MAG: hypothetical protein Q4D32_09120 [Eubacteriales bacterium]|nr:hypothetical protein [Eubacteriales bacterium]